ncbi:LTA synthase family protein [Neisseria lisongii]|uniref:LTA synthase family protein n=1 Tax=Neisseria lisongii TaxID=2912188 RepID=A0AAW5AME6_9NEIS|nr:LTA synthase family protein [Neisseria lisongii]MCF7528767.1 LTA synthase family protein [Neisseria lisongii]MCF7529625.1 LTA synthase family protein [Neisseria lisongii]
MNTLLIRIVLFSLMLFCGVRFALFYTYADYFSQGNLFKALLNGIRFDGKLTVLILLPFLLLLSLPFHKLNHIKLRRFCAWSAGIILAAAFCISVADIAYFGEVQRHLGSEILLLGNDTVFIWQTAFGSRLAYTLAGLSSLLILFFLWKRLVMPEAKPVSGCLKIRIVWSVLHLLLLVFLARGMVVKGKALNTVDAFDGNGQVQANLTLNGVLVTVDTVRNHHNNRPLVYLNEADSNMLAAQYPQPFRYRSLQQPSGKNIVFILLESWSYRYIDALAGNHFGVTPNMDKLISQSTVWDNFHAAGQRSIIGIQAALTSVPALPDRQPLGFGLELNNMSRIAELAGKQGYRTLMVQSSKRRSFHMDGIAQALGFQEYYGQEDIPLIRRYPQEMPPFGWDYDTLMFLGKQLGKLPDQPFFAFLFTGTTHEPFADAGAEFQHYQHDKKGENGFLNTLSYSDWAIGEFMSYAAKQPWYRNTVFVFCADHTLNSGSKPSEIKQRFHIPLVIFDPTHPVAGQRNELSSQYDLLPTFVDILGIQTPVYTFGQSLLAQTHQNLPLTLNQGNSMVMLAADGSFAQLQGKEIVTGSSDHSDLKLWKWRMQTADQYLRQNIWIPPNQ